MYTIGIDLGGTNIVASVVDDDYNIIGTSKTPTNSPRSADEIFDDIADVCEEAVKTAGLTMEDIDSVGMGTPGTVNQDGVIEFANNLAFNNVPARTMLAKRINKPEEKVFIENDANCAALAEFHVGAGRESKRFVTITLGTGVGAGIIHNGKIYHGANGMAGEVGHMVIEQNGLPCPCGRHGCWEQYASATALKRMTAEALAAYPDSILARVITENDGHVSGQSAFIAAREGDPVGQLVCDRYVDYLACGVVNVVNIFQPDTLAIGGGVSNEADEQLLLPVQQRVARESIPCGKDRRTRIVKAQLGNRAGLIGAALLGKNKRI